MIILLINPLLEQVIMAPNLALNLIKDYKNFLHEIKNRIKASRLKAALAVNQELIKFYWEIGQLILENKRSQIGGIS